MSEYGQVKLGKLKLKGQGGKEKKKSKKKRKHDGESTEGGAISSSKALQDETKKYHGWWPLKTFDDLGCGIVSLQSSVKNAYIYAVDNGTLTLGADHEEACNGVPVDEEVFTVIKISENKVAFKSGYGKFLRLFSIFPLSANILLLDIFFNSKCEKDLCFIVYDKVD